MTLFPEETLATVLEAVDQISRADLITALALVSDDCLRVVAARGPLATGRLERLEIDLGRRPHLAAALAREAPTLLSESDHHDEPDTFSDALDLPGDHSCLVAPLRTAGRTVGVMTLDAAACDAFSPEQVRAIGALAAVAARALAAESRSRELARQNASLAAAHASLESTGPVGASLVGASPAFREAVEKIRLVAPTPATVLLTGETGTGKEQAARALHQWSARAAGPFIALNCSALQPDLALSELFGHEKGAFTGADRQRPGRFELAAGGTLFLDEVAELPPGAQAQLLRVLQERTFERVGGSRTLEADVRVVAATHRDLEHQAREGRFREDLYYRLATFPIALPALRERPGDVPLLAHHLLRAIAERHAMPRLELGADALRALEAHHWPGNVRELGNQLERAAILAGGRRIGRRHLDLEPPPDPVTGAPTARASSIPQVPGYHLPPHLPRWQRALATEILRALDEAGARIAGPAGAAERLGLPVSTLRSKIQRLGLRERPSPRR